MNTPSISVIMPVYNAEKYLKKAIDSILNQTYKDFEFIIIDGGSTDNSQKIIESYTDKRISAIQKANFGLIDTLNLGISLCKGDWIARMDADDISYPNRLEEQLKYIKDDVAVIGSQADIIDKDGKVYATTSFEVEHDEIVTKLLKNNSVIIHPSVIINKSKLICVGGYDLKIFAAEDYDLWLKISKVWKIINVNKPLLALRKHENNVGKIQREATINNGFVSLAYHFRSTSEQIMSENDYILLRDKVSIIVKLYREKLIELEVQKEQIGMLSLNSKYVYVLLHPRFLYNYLLIRLLKVWVLFRIKNLKQL